MQFFRFSEEEKKTRFTHVSSMYPLDFKRVVKMNSKPNIYMYINLRMQLWEDALPDTHFVAVFRCVKGRREDARDAPSHRLGALFAPFINAPNQFAIVRTNIA